MQSNKIKILFLGHISKTRQPHVTELGLHAESPIRKDKLQFWIRWILLIFKCWQSMKKLKDNNENSTAWTPEETDN